MSRGWRAGLLSMGALVFLVWVGWLPQEVLLLVLGPGILLGSLVVPDGLHSDFLVLFVSVTVLGAAGGWWLIVRAVRLCWQALRGSE